MGQQHDQCSLAHKSGLAAHIRAGDHRESLRVVQVEVIGDKGLRGGLLDHRVTPRADIDSRLVVQLRCGEVQRVGPFGQAEQDIQRGQGLRRPGQWLHVGGDALQQFGVQLLFACQCAFTRREHLVLELLELGCDEALGVLECLPPCVVVWCCARLRARQLDVVAVHAVVAHLEAVGAESLPLPCLQVAQIAVRVARQAA